MKNISFDIAGLILLCVLFGSIVFRKMTTGTANRMFLFGVKIGILATCFDIWATSLDNIKSSNVFLVSFCHGAFLILHNINPPLQVFFVISLLDIWHKINRKKALLPLLIAPYAYTFLAVITNPFTNAIFTVDSENGYHHSWAFYSVYVPVIIYLIVDSMLIICYRKQLKIRKVISLFTLSMLPMVAVGVHLIVPSQRLECFGIAVAMMFVSVGIQRPEDYMDTSTGLFKLSAYATDMRRNFENGKHVHVVMLNIGNIENLRSMMGYDLTEELIRVVAKKIMLLNQGFRADALIYYLDRGRYRIVFSDKKRERAEVFADALLSELKVRSSFKGFDINLAPYVVLARCPEEIENFKSLMAFGQDFHEKNPYTGQVMMAHEVYHRKEFTIHNNIDAIIERALDHRSFQVYYQPIYSTEQGRFVSAEALLRLFDEEHGFISPEILIPAAEKSGAIHKIGAYVFEEVCKFVSSDTFKQLNLDYIEVNLSVAQCMHGDLADNILTTMNQYNVSPENINLEITETAASYSQRVMTENLNKLSRAGLTFSLDDYGTGYSNMKRVIQLPLKIIKLDKSFVDEQHNPKMWIFLQNTVKMFKDMQMEIVVEGIETQEMVDAFSNLKCDFIQGYFFSKPISQPDFVEFISNSR